MANIEDNSEWSILQLNDDEADHHRQISKAITHHLSAAEDAAVIAVNGLMSLEKPPAISDSQGIVLLLLVKSAKNVRFAMHGLKLGYYSGASSILRSAFEDLSYATLFDAEPSQIARWFYTEFAKIPSGERSSLREKQRELASNALFSQENDRIVIEDALFDYIKQSNTFKHPSIKGLSEEFGIDVTEFVDEDLEESIENFPKDLNKALERYVLKTSRQDFFRAKNSKGKETKDGTLFIELPGPYSEGMLSELVMFGFYIAHRLLDSVKIIFEIKDKDFLQLCGQWHKNLKELDQPTGH